MAINRLLYTIYSGNPFTGTLVPEKCVKHKSGTYYVGVETGTFYSADDYKEIAYGIAQIGEILPASVFEGQVTQQYQDSKIPFEGCTVSIVPHDKIGENKLYRCVENSKIFHENEIADLIEIIPIDVE